MLFENTNSVRDRKQTYIYGLGKRIAVSNEHTDSQVPTYLSKYIDFEFDTAFRQNTVKSQYQTSSPDNQGANGTARIEYLSTQGLEMSSINPGSAGRSAGVRWNASGFASFSGGECTLDGIYESCHNIRRLIGYEGNGGAVQCPSGGCGPQGITFTRISDGDSMSFLTTGFMAFANGISGNFYPTSLGLGTPQAQADLYGLARDLQAAGVTANQLNQIDRANFSVGGSGGQTIQHPTRWLSSAISFKSWHDLTREYLNNNPDCAKLIESLFDQLKKDTGLDVGNNIMLFIGQMEKTGRLDASPSGVSGAGGVANQVDYGQPGWGFELYYSGNSASNAITYIGELIHSIGRRNGISNFSDRAAANAMKNMGIALSVKEYQELPEIKAYPRPRMEYDLEGNWIWAASHLWHNILEYKCGVTKKKPLGLK